jgi:uncharacterized protein YodC (DUF2158 family)
VAELTVGDVVVLKSGSMRMIVTAVEGGEVSVLWANEGAIGRDVLPAHALNKWEDRGPREERPFTPRGDRPFTPRGDRPFTPRAPREDGDRPFKPRPPRSDDDGDERPARPFGGDRKGGGKPFGGKPFGGGKPGMDGKPRAKGFFRKDG